VTPAIHFSKYQALGNSYLVLPALPDAVAVEQVLVPYLCDWRIGIGSDGVLLGPLPSRMADFRVRIFNPDGGEAEKSGNGLRIFCRYLWDKGLVKDEGFTIETRGGVVSAQLLESGQQVRVDMGRVAFQKDAASVRRGDDDAILERVQLGEESLNLCTVSIGNPHCVVLVQQPTEAMARRLGPLLECHPMFPGKTNVQFMEPLDMDSIRIEIWERGAGYTYASGSSSCAAAAVAYRLGLVHKNVTVQMRRGSVSVDLDETFRAIMTGPVTHICDGILSLDGLAAAAP
jgi:diaminopimelate epimerase